mgnify:CR=1 FL=1
MQRSDAENARRASRGQSRKVQSDASQTRRNTSPDMSAPLLLIVEDELAIQELIVFVCEAEGFRTTRAGSIAEARSALAAERPAAQRFTIACGYDAEGDTVSVYLTPAEGGTIPDAIVGNDLTTLDTDTVFVWPEVEGFDSSAASIEKNDYSCIVTLPLPEEHAELVTIHVYFLPDGETEPFVFAETVRTTPYKEAAS